MKKIWLAALAGLVLTTSSALAADLGQPYYKAPPPPPPPPPSWTGFYIGVNGGWGEAQRSGDLFCAVANCGVLNGSILRPNGGLVGGTIGYNWQLSPLIVWGIEADGQWADIHGSATAFVGPLGRDTLTASEKIDSFGTVRGRLGITPWGSTAMLYVTGGVIFGEGKASASLDIPGPGGGFFSRSVSNTRAGGTVGLGMEYMFTPSFSAKIEGLWFDMGSRDLFLPTLNATAHSHLEGTIVRGGLNWHVNWFGGGGPEQYAAQ
jgi:outer membrane immunogenic protein